MLFTRNLPTVNLFGTEVPEPRVFLDFLGFLSERNGSGLCRLDPVDFDDDNGVDAHLLLILFSNIG